MTFASHVCVIAVTAWISINHVQVVQTETHVLTPENCPAPLQDPKAAASAASRAIFKLTDQCWGQQENVDLTYAKPILVCQP